MVCQDNITERASALQALASVMHKRIQLERQAYNNEESQVRRDDRIDEIKITVVSANQNIYSQ